MSELELPGSRRASTLSGVGARHRLRGGSGRSNVFGLIYGALLYDLRVSDSQCTSARDPSHHPAACVSRPDAAHLQWSDRAEDSELRLRSRPYYHGLPRRLRKRCEKSFYRAKLSHFRDVPHCGARRGRVRPSPATQAARLWRRERPVPGQVCMPTSRLHQLWPWGGRRGALGLAVCYMLKSDMF